MSTERRVAGIDGCKAGWIGVSFPINRAERAEVQSFATFSAALDALPRESIIAVDMPIGLPECTLRGGRNADWAAREFLGPCRARVFPVPSRSAVAAFGQGYAEVCKLARKTSDPARAPSKQAFWIFPRILEIDTELRRDASLRHRIFEVHPEVAFALMNGGPVLEPKKVKGRGNPEGLAHRRCLLEARDFPVASLEARLPKGAGLDDLYDACACAWSAVRIAEGKARDFPEKPETDAEGLPIAIRA